MLQIILLVLLINDLSPAVFLRQYFNERIGVPIILLAILDDIPVILLLKNNGISIVLLVILGGITLDCITLVILD